MPDKGATLDMSLFFGTADEKQFFCTELLRLLKSRGGVKIQNHSIPDEDIHKLFDMVCLSSRNLKIQCLQTMAEPQVLFPPLRDKDGGEASTSGQP